MGKSSLVYRWNEASVFLKMAMIFAILAVSVGTVAILDPGLIRPAITLIVLAVVFVAIAWVDRLVLSPEQAKVHLHREMFWEAFGVTLPGPQANVEEREFVQAVIDDVLTRKAFLLRGLYDAENEFDGNDESTPAMRVFGFVCMEKDSSQSFYRLSALAHREGFRTLHDWKPYTEGLLPLPKVE